MDNFLVVSLLHSVSDIQFSYFSSQALCYTAAQGNLKSLSSQVTIPIGTEEKETQTIQKMFQ